MRKGQPFFSIAMPHPAHRRMARMLVAFGRDGELPMSRWELTCAAIGRDKCERLGCKRAKHLSERIIGAAEREGFISRLPSRRRTKFPNVERDNRQPELSYAITPEGIAFRDRQIRFDDWVERGMRIASRPWSDSRSKGLWRARKLREMREGR